MVTILNIMSLLDTWKVDSMIKMIFYMVRYQNEILTIVVLHLNWFINITLAIKQWIV